MPGAADPSKPCDPFQPFGSDAIDPFQSKKGLGDPFSGKDPFAPSTSSKDSKDSLFSEMSDSVKVSVHTALHRHHCYVFSILDWVANIKTNNLISTWC